MDVSRTSAELDAHYFDREISLLQFNMRVLELAQDPQIPLLERLRFLTISSTNLDEFFEIRVAGLMQHIAYHVGLTSPGDLSPEQVYRQVIDLAHQLVDRQYQVLNDELLPALQAEGIRIRKRGTWTDPQVQWIQDYYRNEVAPVLTPVGLDPAHPFPRILNKSLNFIVSLKGKDAFGRSSRAAVVQAPRTLPRLIPLPPEISEASHEFVMLSSVIHEHVSDLFPGMRVKGCYQFRVTRDSDLWVDEEEVDDLMNALKGELSSRRFGGAARLEIADNCSEEMQEFLLDQFLLDENSLYRVNGPVNVHRISALYDLVDRPDLKYTPFLPVVPTPLQQPGVSPFAAIRKGDILLHHPYQSFSPVIELLRQAATDPDVLAVKMTVYRTGSESAINDALLEAAAAGKEVTAVVELRARFDEATNIDLASRLQENGAKVVYGIVGYKAHAKMLMVVRRESGKLRRYVHLGTGNYHVGTTKAYTDFGLLTCDPEIGDDVHNLFQQLTGLGKVPVLKRLIQAPFALHAHALESIRRETENARAGGRGRIIAKMNALIEPVVIHALYEASQAGVEIDLIVRGVCCLRPGVPGISDNIRVRSIMGRFLEHTRIFYFYADGDEEVYLSSADWMQRNFFRRVEVCFPIHGKKQKRRVMEEGLQPYLLDNCSSWLLDADGNYTRQDSGEAPPCNAQQHLLDSFADDSRLAEGQ